MLLTDVAVIPLTQVPLLSMVFFEVSDALVMVILVPLIENELWVVHDPADYKLIERFVQSLSHAGHKVIVPKKILLIPDLA